MTAPEVIARLTEVGVRISRNGNKLAFEPGSKVSQELLSAIKANKDAIVEWLERQFEEQGGPSLHAIYRRPPPIGYGGYDLTEVALAERRNDRMGVLDPIRRSLNCWSSRFIDST